MRQQNRVDVSLEVSNNPKDYWVKMLNSKYEKITLSRMENKYKDNRQCRKYSLDKDIVDRLSKLSKKEDLMIYIILLSAFQITVSKYSGESDFLIGIPQYLKSNEMINNNEFIIIPTYINSESVFKDFLIEDKKQIFKAYNNQTYPIVELSKRMNSYDDINLYFAMKNIHSEKQIDEILVQKNNDLTFIVERNNEEINIIFSYFSDEISKQVNIIINLFINIVKEVLSNLDVKIKDIEAVEEDEKNKLILGFNNTYKTYPKDKTIHQLFEEQVEKTPNNIAIVFECEEITYKKLNERANALARTLIENGVTSDSRVGIMLEPSIEMVVGNIAILKAGGAYVPIEPTYPIDRIKYILEDCSIDILITKNNLKENLIFEGKILDIDDENIYSDNLENIEQVSSAHNLAYVIYTSGTSGRPKGVMIEHRGITNTLQWRKYEYNVTEKDNVLPIVSNSFDGFVTSFYTPIISGAKVRILSNSEKNDVMLIKEKIIGDKITHLIAVPSLCSAIMDMIDDTDEININSITVAGEMLTSKVVAKCKNIKPSIEIFNEYGPTENSVISTVKRDINENDKITIGKPISNTRIYILDKLNNIVPIGVVGEICISGDGLARGYINNNGLTSQKFIENPYEASSKMYKTGDLARWLPDGNIEFLGRIDHQVKIRGFRIELAEIEKNLLRIQGVKECAVIDKGEEGNKYLCAYYISEKELEVRVIREELKNFIPDYMIPSYFTRLEKVELTSNGKIDRKALLKIEDNFNISTVYEVPRNELEEKLVKIWTEILDVEKIGIDDNFFELGGHSLKATLLVGRIHKALNVEIPLKEIFRLENIKGLSEYIISIGEKEFKTIGKVEEKEYYEASSAQERMYMLQELDKYSTVYNMPGAIEINGKLEFSKVKKAFKKIIERHETLRTSFEAKEDSIIQRIHKVNDINFEVEELVVNSEEEINNRIYEFVKSFDLSKAPLLRVAIIKIKEERNILLFDMHHIISDGVSMAILTNEFVKAYEGKGLENLTIQYKDYSVWQNNKKESDEFKKQKEYWIREFNGEIPVLNLPTDYLRAKVKNFKGNSISFTLDSDITNKLNLMAKETGTTMYMLLLTNFKILLSKYSGQEDIIIGSPIAGRNHRDLENIIGMFVNTLAIRSEVNSKISFKEYLEVIKEKTLNAYENQDYQFEELVDTVQTTRDLSRNPLFDIMFIFQNMNSICLEVEGLNIKPYSLNSTVEPFDITITAIEESNKIHLNFNYATSLYKQESIERMGNHFINIIKTVAENIEVIINDIELLGEEEKNKILIDFNNTFKDYSVDKTIHGMFEEQAKKTPNNIAVSFEEDEITYKDLNERANMLARTLKEMGVRQDSVVGIMVERSIDMITGIIAILKSGGAYLPVDPKYPKNRINYILENSGAEIIITEAIFKNNVISKCKVIDIKEQSVFDKDIRNLDIMCRGNNLAYVIYTSGTTGNPKGVMIEHNQVNNFIEGINQKIDLKDYSSILCVTTISFDIFGLETLFPLTNGMKISITSNGDDIDGDKLSNIIEKNNVEIMQSTPSRVKLLMDNHRFRKSLNKLKVLLVGGEAITSTLLNELNKYKELRIYNMYGPTETTIWSTIKDITAENKITIGKPISNTKIYILDKSNKIVPIGVAGEICISGDGLARGYINNEELTTEKFIENPYELGAKMYKTGDLGKWLQDGDIEFLGRIDYQVKIRGFRIELEEIESSLSKLYDIKECIVIDKGEDGNKYLCAYYVSEKEFDAGEIRKELKKSLPDYMIPSYFIKREKMPLTPNGKIDRKELRRLEDKISINKLYEGPRNELEEKLIKIWGKVLGIDKVGITDNFFELGGHSLKATLLVGRIYNELNVEIPLKEIFRVGDIKGLSEYMMSLEEKEFRMIEKVKEKEYYEASSTQKRMYMLQEFDKESIAHNITGAMDISGKLEVSKVKKAFEKIIEKHETLRTSFESDEGNIIQIIHNVDDINFKVEEIVVTSQEELNNRMSEFVEPFNLAKAPLLRIGVFKINEERSILLFDMHHIISDGTSMSILANEFVKGYEGKVLDDLSIQYKDYTAWQLNKIQSDDFKRQGEYWIGELSGDIPALNLPTDYTRGSEIDFKGNIIRFTLNRDVTKKLKDIAKETGSTMYMVLLANIKILLSKYSGQEDIIVGSLIAGRNHSQLENIIGMFVNTLVIRSTVSGEISFREYLKIIKEKTLNAYENQDYQFEELLEKVAVSRDLSRNPYFDVMFILQNMEAGNLEIKDLSFKPYNFNNSIEHFDMTVYAEEVNNEVAFKLSYATRLFKQETIDRMINNFLNMVERIIDNIEVNIKDIEVVNEAEKNKLLVEFNNNYAEYPKDKTIQELFEAQVKKTPNNIAVSFEDKQITYKELNERSNALARTLRAKGAEVGTIVGIIVDRSLEMIIGVLAIIKSGAAYVPIDPNYPTNRIKYMLQNSNVSILITELDLIDSKELKCEIIDVNDERVYSSDTSNLEVINRKEDLLYVLYTSGTTGNPKGVMIEQRNLINMVYSWRDSYNLDKFEVRLLQIASIAFDVFVGDICRSLLTGGTMYICPTDVRLDMKELYKLINEKRINILESTPSLLIMFMQYISENNMEIDSLKLLILGSDSCKIEDYKELTKKYGEKMRVINSYGITEATIDSSYYEESVENIPSNLLNTPIGKPMQNVKFYILNDEYKVQPIGAIGELYIGGEGIARGYNNNEELTKSKFVDNPFELGKNMYKTGDLARWLPDGNVEFLGRKDYQVKIRGFRIEIGEIENTLLKIEGIKDVVVIDVDISQNKYLCAYYAGVKEFELSELRKTLKSTLPDYMVPLYFIRLEKLPLTPNGKIDRTALPKPDGRVATGTEYEAPRTEMEKKLAVIWSEVLGVEKVGINDNFFELGGHSLKATALVSKIHKEFNTQISLLNLFKSPTIVQVNELIKNSKIFIYGEIKRLPQQEYYELSYAQKRLWIINQLKPNSTAYNMPGRITLFEKVDESLIKRVFDKLTVRHEAFRTMFKKIDGNPVQIINNEVKLNIDIVDLSQINDVEQMEIREQIFEEQSAKIFNLEVTPLIYVKLVKIKEEEYDMIFSMHHIISDGGSMEILKKEFCLIYNAYKQGEEYNLEPLKIQYRDFASWQNKFIQDENNIKEAKEFWLSQLSGKLQPLDLPFSYEPSNLNNNNSAGYRIIIKEDYKNKLKDLARDHNTSLFVVLLTTFKFFLSDLTGQNDILIGTAGFGRNHEELKNIIGYFINTTILRNEINLEESFVDLLKRININVLNALEYQNYPIELILDELKISYPKISAFFNMLNMGESNSEHIEDFGSYHVKKVKDAKFDIVWYVTEYSNGIEIMCNYLLGLFEDSRIESIMGEYVKILEKILQNPNKLLKEFKKVTTKRKL